MPVGLMCRSALTAAECSVRGENLSFVGEGCIPQSGGRRMPADACLCADLGFRDLKGLGFRDLNPRELQPGVSKEPPYLLLRATNFLRAEVVAHTSNRIATVWTTRLSVKLRLRSVEYIPEGPARTWPRLSPGWHPQAFSSAKL
eukprot:366555-Chlamydomonas_euryale.AAC.6